MRQGNASITQKLESKPQTQHLVDCPTFQLVYSTEINSEGKEVQDSRPPFAELFCMCKV